MTDIQNSEPTLSNSRLQAPVLPPINKITIDKIRLVGNFNHQFIHDLLTEKDVNLDVQCNDDYSYFKGKYTNADNATLNFEYSASRAKATNSNNIWVEWNPNKFTDLDLIPIRKVLLKYINNGHLTRIDLAFDIEQDLSDFKVFKDRPVKQRVFYGSDGKLETRYVGSPVSDRFIKIYNKKLELEKEQNKYTEQDVLWRFEITLKTKKIQVIEEALKNIQLYKPYYEDDNISDIRTRAMLHYLDIDENNWHKLDKKTVTKYRKLIKETQDFELTGVLNQHLLEQKDRLIEQMNKYLSTCNTSQKIHS